VPSERLSDEFTSTPAAVPLGGPQMTQMAQMGNFVVTPSSTIFPIRAICIICG